MTAQSGLNCHEASTTGSAYGAEDVDTVAGDAKRGIVMVNHMGSQSPQKPKYERRHCADGSSSRRALAWRIGVDDMVSSPLLLMVPKAAGVCFAYFETPWVEDCWTGMLAVYSEGGACIVFPCKGRSCP